MELEIAKKLSAENVAILIAVFIYIAKSISEFVAKSFFRAKDKTEENTQAVRELNINIQHLNSRLVLVEHAIKELDSFKHIVFKLEKDVTFAHEKIRDLRGD